MKNLTKSLIILTSLFTTNIALAAHFELGLHGDIFSQSDHLGMELPSSQSSSGGCLAPPLIPGWSCSSVTDKISRNHYFWGLSAGYLFDVTPTLSIGPELGYTLTPDVNYQYQAQTMVAIPSATIVTTTNQAAAWSSSYVDLLATARYNLGSILGIVFKPDLASHFVFIGKAGVADVMQKNIWSYGVTSTTGTAVNTNGSNMRTQILPEIQAGIGYQPIKALTISIMSSKIFGGDNISDTDFRNVQTYQNFNKIEAISSSWVIDVNYAF